MSPAPPRSMLGRACAAVALTAGFYTLALGLAAALIVGPVYLWATNGHGNVWLTIAAFAAGFTILKALVPERERFDAPGPQLTAAAQPELVAELGAVADAVGEPLPPQIYLDGGVNASVAEISNGLLRGRRRIMILGLPLLAALTPAQLRAVIAHEYGHYVGGDTRFSAWIWRTRVAILKTVHALDVEESWFQRVVVRMPFLLYAKLFLRLTNAISRRAEFAADAVAARVAGAQAHAEALRAVSAAAPAYASYWRDDVAFALEHGRRPPIAAGFHGFLGSHDVRAQVDKVVEAEIAEAECNPYDSHPTLADRLRAVGAEPTGQVSLPAASESAAALLRDPAALELALLQCRFGVETVAQLEAIGWEQAGDHLPLLRRSLGEDAHAAPPEELLGYWRFALGRLALSALRRDGWTIQSTPGTPLVCRRGDDVVEPYSALSQAVEDALAAADWRETCTRLGVANLRLVPADAAAGGVAAAASARGVT